jgi:hypothetical protein
MGPDDWLHTAPTLDEMTALLANSSALAACLGSPSESFQILTTNIAFAEEAAAADIATAIDPEEPSASTPDTLDIWLDLPTLSYIQSGEFPGDIPTPTRRRVLRRARNYRWQDNTLSRLLPAGALRVVPPPDARPALIRQIHERCGHFGERRTVHLLLLTYWWQGLGTDVASVLKTCEVCDRVNTATFNAPQPDLNSLPIEGLFYRWGVDLCGPFDTTSRNNQYAMVCIEHFSKWVEIIPIPNKESATVAFTFLHSVLSRFGSCAEVLTDQGREFQGDFAQLLLQCFIDHRTTSPNHPQADGLAERAVQTLKKGLRKYCGSPGHPKEWDEHMAWVAMGYRCSPQQSTKLSPYQMLFAVPPTIPSSIAPKFSVPIDFDDPDAAWLSVLSRAKLASHYGIIAGTNLKIAQHRDQLRYGRLRGGGYVPRIRKFEPGDYVYTQRTSGKTTLETAARREILRVKEVRDLGTLLLQGKCGQVIVANAVNCSPCHLPNIDGTIDRSLRIPDSQLSCSSCLFPDDQASMLLCDFCERGYHMTCLNPPITEVPKGEWACPACVLNHPTLHAATDLRSVKLPPAVLSGAELDGIQVLRKVSCKELTALNIGIVRYLGPSAMGPAHYTATFIDGFAENLTATQVRGRHKALVALRNKTLPGDPMEQREEATRTGRKTPTREGIRASKRLRLLGGPTSGAT